MSKVDFGPQIKKEIEMNMADIKAFYNSGEYLDIELLLNSILLEIGKKDAYFTGDAIMVSGKTALLPEFEIYWHYRMNSGVLLLKVNPFVVSTNSSDPVEDFNRAMSIL